MQWLWHFGNRKQKTIWNDEKEKKLRKLKEKIHTFWKQWKYSVAKKIYEIFFFLVGKEYEAIFDLIQWQIDFCAQFYVEKKKMKQRNTWNERTNKIQKTIHLATSLLFVKIHWKFRIEFISDYHQLKLISFPQYKKTECTL